VRCEELKGIIFDMDGVLLHSSPINECAFRDVLADLPIHTFEYTAVAGMRTDEALQTILMQNDIPHSGELIASLAAAKTRRAREKIARDNPVDPQCGAVLERLARKYLLALASSASEATVDLFVDRNAVRERFSCILNGSDVRGAKPAPDIYELACRRLGLPPSECLIVEDAVSGVRAGKSAGATVWGLASTCSANELKQAGADRVLDGLGDLVTALEKP
jgi:beta-phosphoglucomutase